MLRKIRFMLGPVLAVLVIALVIAGCGGGGKDNAKPTSPTTSKTTAPAGGGGGEMLNLSADPSGGLSFKPNSLSAKAGKVTLMMKNPSSAGVQHGVAIEGNGVDKDGAIVSPGKTSTVTVDLKPGKYEFYCPFDGHKAGGMTGTLTVN